MIFVTGGTGLLGNCIVRELCERGEPVRVLCRAGTSREPFAGLPVEIVEGDLSNADLLESAISGCQATVHSAAFIHIGWDNLQQSRAVNVEGTHRIATACLKNASKLIHVSTVDTLPAASDPQCPMDESGSGGMRKTPCSYVVSKSEAEHVVRDLAARCNLQATIVHPGFMLGPFDWKPSSGRMMLEVCKAPLAVSPPGGCSVCDARDVAVGVANAINVGEPGRNYILAGENLTYQQLWARMLSAAGRKKHVFRVGPAIRILGKAIDLANRYLPIREGDVNGAAISMGCLNHFYTSARAEEELGYRRRPLEETLFDAWSWLSNRFK